MNQFEGNELMCYFGNTYSTAMTNILTSIAGFNISERQSAEYKWQIRVINERSSAVQF